MNIKSNEERELRYFVKDLFWIWNQMTKVVEHSWQICRMTAMQWLANFAQKCLEVDDN